MSFVIGDQVIFSEKPVKYGQDFGWHRAPLPQIPFRIAAFTHQGTYAFLRGVGYGDKGQYGNGHIHMALAEIEQTCASHIPYIPRTWEAERSSSCHPLRVMREL